MSKKVIDPQPIIEQLKDMAEASKGLVSSILRGVISMLVDAPTAEVTSKFVLINNVYINIDQIRSFAWKNGELCVWYAGRHFFESWPDPDRKLYKDLCYMLGLLLPTKKPEV